VSLGDQDPKLADFAHRVGDSFVVSVRGHHLMLALAAAEPLPGSMREAGGFRLEFLGPGEPRLDQGIFPFEIEDRSYDLFIVPIGRDDRGARYEAVFY
jgi:hypothetical protein